MRTVWKYTLEVQEGPQTLKIPYKSRVLLGPHIAVQNGHIALWAEVETEDEPRDHVFHVFGTGWEIPENVDYLGTVLMHDGAFVWHVFLEVQSSPDPTLLKQ